MFATRKFLQKNPYQTSSSRILVKEFFVYVFSRQGVYTNFLVLFWQVERHREHLINYIIFLRITPFLPNWFINITSPVINVPLKVFFIGTFLGKSLVR